jgi:hypothetical protein
VAPDFARSPGVLHLTVGGGETSGSVLFRLAIDCGWISVIDRAHPTFLSCHATLHCANGDRQWNEGINFTLFHLSSDFYAKSDVIMQQPA